MSDHRKQFFFWLGVLMLPVFWAWFTLARGYSRRQRFAAFAWLGITVLWFAQHRNALMDHWQTLSITYPAVLGWVTVVLVLWLVFRTGSFSLNLIEVIILVEVFHLILPSLTFEHRLRQTFDWDWVFWPLVLALTHLLLDSLTRKRTMEAVSKD